MSKPHIKKINGIKGWICQQDEFVSGMGADPFAAYNDMCESTFQYRQGKIRAHLLTGTPLDNFIQVFGRGKRPQGKLS